MSKSLAVGVFGTSGYAGAELMRLAAGHPNLNVVLATADTQAGGRVADLYPSLASAYPDITLERADPDGADGLDLVFLALPHGAAQHLVPQLRKRVGVIVDLSADFRLRDATLYPTWYGAEHPYPELLDEAAFGIPELFRDELAGATLVAAAGCYPTAAALAIAPLVRDGAIEPAGVVVDAASGVSGAGRAPKPNTHLTRWTRISRPTGCSRTAIPLRSSRQRGRGDLHPPSGPHEPGDPRHVLRPAGGRVQPAKRDTRSRCGCSRILRRASRSWWCPSAPHRPKRSSDRTPRTSPAATTPAPDGWWSSPPSTT